MATLQTKRGSTLLRPDVLWTVLLLVVIFAASLLSGGGNALGEEPGAGLEERNGVVIEPSLEYQETTYTVTEGACRLSWTLYQTELNKRVIRHRADCDLTLRGQLPLLARLLASVLATWPEADSLEILFYGRLTPDGAIGPLEMSRRLALAAKKSPRWDAKKGRPANGLGQMNKLVTELAREGMIYPELKSLFAEFDLELKVISVEKVLVDEAGDLPFYQQMKKEGVHPKDRLPHDCQIWFSISR